MKTYFILSSIFILNLLSRPANCSEVEIANGVKLEFHYDTTVGGETRELILHAKDKRESIWSRNDLEPVLIDRYWSTGFYPRMELTTAAMNKGVILAIFRLSPGKHRFVAQHELYPDYPFERQGISSNFDMVAHVFTKQGSKWIRYLSFYPQTIYGDVVNESVAGITIHDNDSFDLEFNGSWRILGRDEYVIDGPFKFKSDQGVTTKQFRYSEAQGLLLAENESKEVKYIERALWWKPNELEDLESKSEEEFRKQIVRKIENQVNRAVEFRIDTESCQFFSKVPKNQEERFQEYIEYLARKSKSEKQ